MQARVVSVHALAQLAGTIPGPPSGSTSFRPCQPYLKIFLKLLNAVLSVVG